MINTNLRLISHRFEVITDYCSNLVRNGHCVFEFPFGA